MFCCIDLETGKRRWKDGRYGNGQVLLLADQPVLLIAAERGDAVLVAADPAAHRELARIPAIKGKTWNHPVVAHVTEPRGHTDRVAGISWSSSTRHHK